MKNAPNVMICAHMDEVGFMVRSIDNAWYDSFNNNRRSKTSCTIHYKKSELQQQSGRKIPAIINGTYNNGKAEKIYADVGAYTAEEVYNLGYSELEIW